MPSVTIILPYKSGISADQTLQLTLTLPSPLPPLSSLPLTTLPYPLPQLQQTWSAMLQMLPLMSKDKAQTLIAHQAFSCPQHLLHHLHHNTDPEISGLSTENKKLLLQHAFGARKGSKNGTVQKQAKLSKHVYNLMTSTEPEDLISKV